MAGTGEARMPKYDEESISALSTTISSARKRSPKRKIKIQKDGQIVDGGMNESVVQKKK